MMTDSLLNILSNRSFDEPTESVAIKRYIKEQFNETASVKVQENHIVITVRSAALAGSLRMHIVKLQRFAATKKKLYFRIG